ncbi:hypothetical protein ASG32_31550 [Methylobacterium sp. Leaf361]|uniref:alpha/beta fold hydrolase n=1 Tax=Methylobacterium sp. Leaf361 TaxID=1736352 RepID=UPI0006F4DBCD|nr:alpha/beta hydrolase [Methylobacterium sp. Leaf361]KQS58188.1 hypothetical protein ASG32_31550 [Methylobacterium sp. Leaf361]
MSDFSYGIRAVNVNGVTLHVVEQGEGPAVLFCHGFPDGWRGWRRQMRAVAEAGYRAIAFDMRGYGNSSRPDGVAQYSLFTVAGDLVGLCNALNLRQAHLVVHDFGALVGWLAAFLRPDLFVSVFGINVPPTSVTGGNILAQLRAKELTDYYMFRFIASEADAAWANAAVTIPGMFYWTSGLAPTEQSFDPMDPKRSPTRPSPVGMPAFIDPEDGKALVAAFDRTGFRSALNYYRALEPFFDQSGFLQGAVLRQPTFLVVGGADGNVKFRKVTREMLERILTDLRGFVELDGIGHWPQLEAGDRVDKLLIDFLNSNPQS